MKALVLFITAVFFAGLVNLFTAKPIPHNETESANSILAISRSDFDYELQMKDVGIICRIGDRRKAFIGTYENVTEFDGKNAYQYIDNQKTPIASFPFEQYDSEAERILTTAQKIISEKLYSAYADDRKNYADDYYYFSISDDGLLLFGERQYVYGLIICEYQRDTFQRISVRLTEKGDDKSKTWYTFGTINYEPVVLP